MSGNRLISEQVKLYMEERKVGKSQESAAAKAGMSERSGRRIEKGELQVVSRSKRYWRTRRDPFVDVWTEEIELLLRMNCQLSPIALFEKLQKDHPANIKTVNCGHSSVE